MKLMTPEGAVSAREWAMQRGTVENYPATARAHIRELADALLSKPQASVSNDRAALARLEAACDMFCRLRTQEQYLSMVDSGQQDALLELDNARKQARAALVGVPATVPTGAETDAASLKELSATPRILADERAVQQLAATGEAKPSIMRFNPIAGLGMNPAANGMYVRYEEHAAMLSRHPASQACEAADMARIVHAAAELHGLITEYQGMPCDSLRQRMFDGARRYGPRIHEARATLPAQPISQKDS